MNNLNVCLPEPPTVEQVLNRTVKEGGNVINECKVTGTPPPTVFWKILNTNEVIYGKLLNIPNISRNQSGEYKCFANNTCGNDSSTTVIDVQCKNQDITLSFFVLARLGEVCCLMFLSLMHVFIECHSSKVYSFFIS